MSRPYEDGNYTIDEQHMLSSAPTAGKVVDRNAVIEECAKVADRYMRANADEGLATYAKLSAAIAAAIRAMLSSAPSAPEGDQK